MKNSQHQPVSFASTWIQKVSIIGLTGMLCLGCTPTTPPPTANENTETTENPVQVAPASVAISPPATTESGEETCTKMMAIVSDPNPPTNIRSTPEVTDNNIVGTLDNGTVLTVKDEQNNWFQVSTRGSENTLEGWVSKSVTESSCSEKTQRITIQGDSNSVTISDRFIGTGSHEYIINANAGQTMTVTSTSGVLPFIFGPNDPNRQTLLANDAGSPAPITWTSELSMSGDYVLDMESNFRGYEYSFTVELK
jgi:hypothetical protein